MTTRWIVRVRELVELDVVVEADTAKQAREEAQWTSRWVDQDEVPRVQEVWAKAVPVRPEQ